MGSSWSMPNMASRRQAPGGLSAWRDSQGVANCSDSSSLAAAATGLARCVKQRPADEAPELCREA